MPNPARRPLPASWRGHALIAVAALATAGVSACAPGGAGQSPPPKPAQFLKVDAAARSAQLTLIAGYPGTATEFNFDGYTDGALTVTVPVQWRVTIKCENQGTVAHSCAVTKGSSSQPADPAWSTEIPFDGMEPGITESFTFTPHAAARYRIACLVPGHEDSGMWVQLDVVGGGQPSITART